jgi:hypothetical protein
MKKQNAVKPKFIVVSGLSAAIQLGNNKKKGEIPQVAGWIVGLKTISKEYGKGKKAETRHMHIFTLAGLDGGKITLWGGGSINNTLLENAGTPKAKIKKEFKDVLTQFTFKGMLPKKPGMNAGRNIEIAIDRSIKLPVNAGRVDF